MSGAAGAPSSLFSPPPPAPASTHIQVAEPGWFSAVARAPVVASSVINVGGQLFLLTPVAGAPAGGVTATPAAAPPAAAASSIAAASGAAAIVGDVAAATRSYVPTSIGVLDKSFAEPVRALWNEWMRGKAGAQPLRALIGKDRSPDMERARAEWVKAIEGCAGKNVKNLPSKYGPFKQLAEYVESRLRQTAYYTASAEPARQAALERVLRDVEQERISAGSLSKLLGKIKKANAAKKEAAAGRARQGDSGGPSGTDGGR